MSDVNRSRSFVLHSDDDSTENQEFIEYASFVFPDFRAIYHLNIKSMDDIVYREVELVGFEIYLVEQWAAQRKLTSLITSYNGNSQDKIKAVQILLPVDINLWPRQFRTYYDELLVYSKPKVIRNYTIFITNLSTFPSEFNLLHIDSGDFRGVWEKFKINYNLKRLRCVGRSALLLSRTSSSSGNKFLQLYKVPLKSLSDMDQTQKDHNLQLINDSMVQSNTFEGLVNHEKNNGHDTARLYPVIELVTIIQTCLYYFGLFDYPREINGLLCDYTKKSINKWWERYGNAYLGIRKPSNEATVSPTTVASIISLVLSCFFKLIITGYASNKDPFDEENFFSGIYNFQKKYGLIKKDARIGLDEDTVAKLFEVSAKVSNADFFNFKTVVKSTVQDIAGKGNFMHLSNDILTTDLSTLTKNIHGGKLAIIWKKNNRTVKDLFKIRKKDFTEFNFNHGNLESILYQQRLYSERIQFKNALQSRNISDQYLSSKYDSNLSMKNLIDKTEYTMNYSDMTDEYLTQKFYKNEYFRRNSIHYSKSCYDTSYKETLVELSRSSSLSCIADTLEVWTLPFDASVVRIARDMLRVKQSLVENKNCGNVELKPANDININGNNVIENMEVFNCKSEDMQVEKNKLVNCFHIFKGHCEGLKNKDMIVSKEKKDLESLMLKMRYNIGILNTRMRDVEVSINRFDRELDRIDKAFSRVQPNIANVVKEMEDDNSLNKYINDLVKAESTKYSGLFSKLFHYDILNILKCDINKWICWFCNRSRSKNNGENLQS